MPHQTSTPRTRTVTLLVVGLSIGASLFLSGCQADAICSSGNYPAAQANGTGSYCVKNGDEPKPGFVRYPAGKVPQHTDDQWDVYWRTHRLDESGKETAGTS